jgi:hypothetical protein
VYLVRAVADSDEARLAILATFSRTGHNQADGNCGGKVDVPALTRTEHYQPDGTFTDWQSGGFNAPDRR